jgi:hypothetical protein
MAKRFSKNLFTKPRYVACLRVLQIKPDGRDVQHTVYYREFGYAYEKGSDIYVYCTKLLSRANQYEDNVDALKTIIEKIASYGKRLSADNQATLICVDGVLMPVSILDCRIANID